MKNSEKLKQLLASSNEDNIRLGFHLITQQGDNEVLEEAMTNTPTKRSFCLEYGFGWLLPDKLPMNQSLAQLLKTNKYTLLPGWKKSYQTLEGAYKRRKILEQEQEKDSGEEPLITGNMRLYEQQEELLAICDHVKFMETAFMELLPQAN